MEEILLWFDKYKSCIEKHKYDEEYIKICQLTSFLDCANPTILQRIWHIKTQNFEIQKCKICGKPATYLKKHHKYSECCGDCVNKIDITDDEVVKFYDNFNKKLFIKTNYYTQLCRSTSFLDSIYDDIKSNQRIWHLRNNNFEIQRCKICGKPTKWSEYYQVVCSMECSKKYANTEECRNKIKKHLLSDMVLNLHLNLIL